MSITKIKNRINGLGMSISKVTTTKDSKFYGYELNTYTRGGVNMLIFLDFRNENLNENSPSDFIQKLSDYMKDFDINETIDLHRKNKDYKDNFTIMASVKDFTGWVKTMENLIRNLKEISEQQSLEDAAKTYAKIPLDRDIDSEERYFNNAVIEYDAFIKGAKFEQERKYFKDEILKAMGYAIGISKNGLLTPTEVKTECINYVEKLKIK